MTAFVLLVSFEAIRSKKQRILWIFRCVRFKIMRQENVNLHSVCWCDWQICLMFLLIFFLVGTTI